MKSIIRVAPFISLAMSAVVWVNLDAQVRQQDVHPTKEIVQPQRLSKDQLFSQDHTADVLAIQQVWTAYAYYNDTENGPGIASLFTKDAIFHSVRNIRGQMVQNAGGGCRLTGRKDIATYFGFNRTANYGPEIHNGLPFPGNTHHIVANILVKVSDDGKTAMLTSTFLFTAVASGPDRLAAPDGKGPRIGSTGEYRIFLRKTSEGWQIAEFYLAGDSQSATTPTTTTNRTCDLNGPIPRPSN